MVEQLTQVPIIVQDQDRALRFYTEALRFTKTQDTQQKDVKRDVEVLRAKGVTFRDGGAQDASFGTVAYFTDTEGNHLTPLQRKK